MMMPEPACFMEDRLGPALDNVPMAAGETIRAAGPLNTGANPCPCIGGDGYAFFELYKRTAALVSLPRAQSFALHVVSQTEADAWQYGQMRYSLPTGDPGSAICLWDCLRGRNGCPASDVFYGMTDA